MERAAGRFARMQNRREFLSTLGTAAGVVAAARLGLELPAQQPARLERLGLQLRTVRTLVAADLERTLADVAAIGYREVEFDGYFGRTPRQVRAALDAAGLQAPSALVSLPSADAEWRRALDDASTVGHGWVVVELAGAPIRSAVADWERIAARLNRLGAAARGRGRRGAYHNSDFELARQGTSIPYDLLLRATDRAMVDFEMDVYSVAKAGGDPLAYVVAHAGRFPLMRLADISPPPARERREVGRGTIDFAALLGRRKVAGVSHLFVEHDDARSPLASARASYRYLTGLEL